MPGAVSYGGYYKNQSPPHLELDQKEDFLKEENKIPTLGIAPLPGDQKMSFEDAHKRARQRLLKAMQKASAGPGADQALLRRVNQLMMDMKAISGGTVSADDYSYEQDDSLEAGTNGGIGKGGLSPLSPPHHLLHQQQHNIKQKAGMRVAGFPLGVGSASALGAGGASPVRRKQSLKDRAPPLVAMAHNNVHQHDDEHEQAMLQQKHDEHLLASKPNDDIDFAAVRNFSLLTSGEKEQLRAQVRALVVSRELEGIDRESNLASARAYAVFEVDRMLVLRRSEAAPAATSAGTRPASANAGQSTSSMLAPSYEAFRRHQQELSRSRPLRGPVPGSLLSQADVDQILANSILNDNVRDANYSNEDSSSASEAGTLSEAEVDRKHVPRGLALQENASALLIQHQWRRKVRALNHLRVSMKRDADGFEVGSPMS
eukprot:g5645.t1